MRSKFWQWLGLQGRELQGDVPLHARILQMWMISLAFLCLSPFIFKVVIVRSCTSVGHLGTRNWAWAHATVRVMVRVEVISLIPLIERMTLALGPS